MEYALKFLSITALCTLTVALSTVTIFLSSCGNLEAKESSPTNVPSDNFQNSQVARFVDCQEIVMDAREIGGKLIRQTICFYDVIIQNKHVTAWYNIKSGKTGFTDMH